jgi:predicted dinucleotide-binding enzyme
MAKVGVIGTGTVGDALAAGFKKHGYEVVRGTREPKAGFKNFAETARFGEIVVLAVKGTAAESAVKLCGPGNLAGKVVIDAMNPIADTPPLNGVLPFFTTHDESLMERLQKMAPKAKFVKAFSCVGSAFMVDPKFKGGPPTMFLCGNDAGAKEKVKGILAQFGWEAEDMGGVEAARAIEPLCILWCLPGFLRNDWSHAFKLLR